MQPVVLLTLAVCALELVSSAPRHHGKKRTPTETFDQRQQGELNIHAQLENIVVVLIPTPSMGGMNLLELLMKSKYTPEKPNDVFQIVPHQNSNEVDNEESNSIQNDVVHPVVTSQQVTISEENKGEKDDEVIATVEEMKPSSTEKTMDSLQSSTTEDSPIGEHSTVAESVQESILKVKMPEELKDSAKEADEKLKASMVTKEPSHTETVSVVKAQVFTKEEETNPNKDSSTNKGIPTTQQKIEDLIKPVSPTEESFQEQIKDMIKPVSQKEEKPQVQIKDMIKPVSPKEEKRQDLVKQEKIVSAEMTAPLTSSRKEKVIRYKPESKWAPGLVDIMGPPKARELDDRQRFSGLCAPGVWDPELKTCIMPGDSRSRSELARFLQTMRLGIAIPSS